MKNSRDLYALYEKHLNELGENCTKEEMFLYGYFEAWKEFREEKNPITGKAIYETIYDR